MSSILGFAISGLAALALIGVGVVYSARRTATDEAVRDSTRITEVVSRGLVEPAIDAGVLTGDPQALQELDTVVRTRVIGESIVRVKLWTRDGSIVYSDEPRLIGQRLELEEEELAALDSGVAASQVSDLNRPENVYERSFGKLLEVYFPVRTRGGNSLLFEAYLPYASVSSNASSIWQRFLPPLVAGLVVLALVQIPLAWSLAHRLRRRQHERETLLRRTVEASERERRFIAGELHDGAVQDLIGQSFRLTATADRLSGTAPEETVRELRDASSRARQTVQELRTLLVELYPPNLSTEGLEPAFSDLAAPLRARGIEISLSVDLAERLPEPIERLLFRCAREALRNVMSHANAQRVDIRVARAGSRATLSVTDDGRGFSPDDRRQQRGSGHVGLDLIDGLVVDAGGTFEIASRDGAGTRFEVSVPLP